MIYAITIPNMVSDTTRKKIEELWNEVFKSKGETPPKVIVLDGGATLSFVPESGKP